MQCDRQADRALATGDATLDGLADPPRGVGRELVAAAPVELLDGADQAEVALLDQLREVHRGAPGELRRDRDHEAQVGADEVVEGLLAVAHRALQLLAVRDVGAGLERRPAPRQPRYRPRSTAPGVPRQPR